MATQNEYLKNLEKKNKAVTRKHSLGDINAKDEEGRSEEDSDLLSLAKEFAEELDSPFIKTGISRKLEPEVPEVPFVSSLKKTTSETSSQKNVGSALASFMKFDRKYSTLTQVNPGSDTESEPIMSEDAAQSPSKIASELEDKHFPSRRRRISSTSSAGKGRTSLGLSPSPRSSRKLSTSPRNIIFIPGLSPSLRSSRKSSTSPRNIIFIPGLSPSPRSSRKSSTSPRNNRNKLHLNVGIARKVSNESMITATPIPTISEISDIQSRSLSPRSPLLDIINLRDISEVLDELKPDEDLQDEDSIVDGEDVVVIDVAKSPDVSTQVEIFNPSPARVGEAEKNPFIFSAEKRKASIDHGSEPKSEIGRKRREDSNKRKSEIQQKESAESSRSEQIKNIILASLEPEDTEATEESQTLKDSTISEQQIKEKKEKCSPKKKKKRVSERFEESPSCYYCKRLCSFHRQEVLSGQKPTATTVLGFQQPSTTSQFQQNIPRLQRYNSTADISVQAGKPTLHHYLFDPTLDATFEPPGEPRDQLINQLTQSAAAESVIKLMKSQLDLTEKHLRIQKDLYTQYCRNLELVSRSRVHENPGEKILYGRNGRNGRSERSERFPGSRLTYSEAVRLVKQEMDREKDDLQGIPVSEGGRREKPRKWKKGEESDIKENICSENNRTRKEKENGAREQTNITGLHGKQNVGWETENESLEEVLEEYNDDFETDSEIQTET
ncbi:uncharacterized protein LOC111698428 [Eurytemora carolleeae]|uniref:uncharacterized protein LOC111698428 n=1 Tax=Eurytemora carolleeae TaxID=1294199 RepID=UPI000C75B7A6|nr:uncharacterized protein LOC111698428 [Eurytemora carolleeae]|eukprot:XP_023324535.1 uncharacterized protein LOC111698428 [Eurytemora affinis]